VTRDEAVATVQALCRAIDPKAKTKGLSPKNVGGVSVGAEAIYFEYAPEAGTLSVMASVYRFKAMPKPAVLEAFRAVEKTEDKGGGRFDYQAPSKSVLLTRVYASAPKAEELKRETERLAAAARRWREQVVPKVAAQAQAAGPRDLS
jgi:hypothetical protein